MKLYYYETPNARKACAVAKHLELPVDYVRVDLAAGDQQKPDFLAINPNGRVPALRDGETSLWESNAIMSLLAQRAESELWPQDERQIDVLRWFMWDAVHFSVYGGTLLFENFFKPTFGLGETDKMAVAEATDHFKKFAGILDGHLQGRTYLVGDSLSVADFAVAAMLPTAEPAELPLDGFHNIERWHSGLMELPAWREPFPG
ncbi:MAG: glutathione S-transferase family protein [Pseudomonadota bacterium]